MSRPGPKSTTANRRVRAFLASLCALSCALPLSSWAGRPVRVYEVDVDGQSAAAVQDAMRQALVRATGRRESADDPALAGVLAEATRYVKSYAVGPRGQSQVVFDGAAVEQAITAAGRSIWDRERPFTLVVLSPPRNRAAEDAASLEHQDFLSSFCQIRGVGEAVVAAANDDYVILCSARNSRHRLIQN